jgi:hypothetical protein
MTLTLRRSLIPLLIGILAMLLSVHQATAIDHPDAACLGEVHQDMSEDHELQHTLHAMGCCVVACGMVAPTSMVVAVALGGSMFAQAADEALPVGLRTSKHFRPPRFT